MSRETDKDDDGLLSRWSRRKRAVAVEEAAAETAAAADDVPQDANGGLTEAELLEKLGLPDPDTLEKGDDFAAFLKANVPVALRRRALHRLWRSDPVLANLDGLIDHGEDYTDAAMVPEVLTTAYKVGRGFLRDLVADALKTEADEDGDTVAAAENPPEASPAPSAAKTDNPAPPSAATDAAHDDAEPEPPKPRRMAFRQN